MYVMASFSSEFKGISKGGFRVKLWMFYWSSSNKLTALLEYLDHYKVYFSAYSPT